MATYIKNANALCPNCQTVVQFPSSNVLDVRDYQGKEEALKITAVRCPNCQRMVVTIEEGKYIKIDTSRYRFEPQNRVVP